MKPGRRTLIGYALSGIAIIAFGAVLGFALMRLASTEAETRRSVTDNMVWVLERTRSTTLLLDRAIASDVANIPGKTDRVLQYDLLLSRLSQLLEGPQARHLEKIGFKQTIADHEKAVLAIENDIANIGSGDVAAAQQIRDIMAPLVTDLGHAANRSMVVHWDETGARSDAINASIAQVIVSVVAIFVLGMVISLIMVRALLDKHLAQQALLHEQKMREAYRNFIDLVSHQFRTPLAVIDSSMQRIGRQQSSMPREEIVQRTGRVRQAVRNLTRLMDMTLKSIRLDGGHLEISNEDCDIAALIDGVVERQKELTPERNIEVQMASDTPKALNSDPLLIEQILTNILSNAVKYSPANETVYISTQLEPGCLAIHVRDTGIGIAENEQSRVFSRFFRSDNARNVSGIGLGLNISLRLAALLGGTLDFQSQQGIGSTFTLRLPSKN